MKNDSAEYGSVHHPWGVIRLSRGRENIDLRLATNGAATRDAHARRRGRVEYD
jgi:hypothetical protein